MKNEISFNLAGKTIVISGSSKGIGKTLARTMGLMGANIVLNGTDKNVLANTQTELAQLGIKCIGIPGNVAEISDCMHIAQSALDHYCSIDILITNAGLLALGSLDASNPAVFKQLMDVNYLGAVYMIKACLPALKCTRGSILITGSVSGIRGIPGSGAYSASKMALTALAESLTIELKKDRIHVGIAYVGLTQADENKLMLNAKGEFVSKPMLSKRPAATQYEVALEMIEMIQERTYKRVFSTLGVINSIITRYVPWIGSLLLKRYYQGQQNMQTHEY